MTIVFQRQFGSHQAFRFAIQPEHLIRVSHGGVVQGLL
jgi:hypothetical protein